MEVFYVPFKAQRYLLPVAPRDEFGKRQKVTTHARTKSQSLRIPSQLQQSQGSGPRKILLSKFIQEVLSYYRGCHLPKTVLLYERALKTAVFLSLFLHRKSNPLSHLLLSHLCKAHLC
jgi:hypothetical protein